MKGLGNYNPAPYSPFVMLHTFFLPFIYGIGYIFNKAYTLPLPLVVYSYCIPLLLAMIAFNRSTKVSLIYFIIAITGFSVGMQLCNSEINSLNRIDSFYIGGTTEIEGSISSRPADVIIDDKNYIKYLLHIETVRSKEDKHWMKGEGFLLIYEKAGETSTSSTSFYSHPKQGDMVTLKGNIKPVTYNLMDGYISMRGRYMDMGMVGRIFNPTVIGRESSKKTYYLNLVDDLRNRLTRQIEVKLPGPTGILVEGLLFGGEYSKLDSEINENFAQTGLIHILSVSGSHITLLLGIFYGIAKFFRWNRWGKIILPIGGITFYSLLVGWSPPVVRATLTGIVCAYGTFGGHQYRAIQSISLILLLQLLISPLLIDDVSLQLSYGASYGILLFYKPLVERFRLGPMVVRSALSITLAAQLCIWPLQFYYFQLFSPSSFLANLIVAPILELVITLSLLVVSVGGIVDLVSIMCGQWIGNVCDFFILTPTYTSIKYIITWAIGLNFTIASFPLSFLSIGALRWYELCLYIGSLYLFFLCLKRYINPMFCLGIICTLGVIVNGLAYICYMDTVSVYILNKNYGKTIFIVPNGYESILYIEKNKYNITEQQAQDVSKFISYYGIQRGNVIFSNEITTEEKAKILKALTNKNKQFSEWVLTPGKKIALAYTSVTGTMIVEQKGHISFALVGTSRKTILNNGQKKEKKLQLSSTNDLQNSPSNELVFYEKSGSNHESVLWTPYAIIQWPSPFSREPLDGGDKINYVVGEKFIPPFIIR